MRTTEIEREYERAVKEKGKVEKKRATAIAATH